MYDLLIITLMVIVQNNYIQEIVTYITLITMVVVGFITKNNSDKINENCDKIKEVEEKLYLIDKKKDLKDSDGFYRKRPFGQD